MSRYFTLYIIVAMLLGGIVGFSIHETAGSQQQITEIAGYFSLVTDIFLRLIKMIIAPLVLSTLIIGITHMGDTASLGRTGAKTLGWFVFASALSLTMGAVLVSVLEPGVGLNLPLPNGSSQSVVEATSLNLKQFIAHLVPKSLVEAMATNEILQIVVFSAFAGTALIAIGEKAKPLIELAESLAYMMLQITGYVMLFAPLAVFAAIASTISTNGLAVVLTYGKFMGGFYASLVILWIVLIGLGALFIGKRVKGLVMAMREPMLVAFSTASSEAAYPKILHELEKFGVKGRIARFVLPLGYSFNLDGSMMYCTFATMFIAQAYGIELSFAQIATMCLLLMVTSKGMAGVPRASLVVIAATLGFFNIPEAGLLLVLAVDQFLDMGRSATNVVGNSVAAAVIAKWEGMLGDGPSTEA